MKKPVCPASRITSFKVQAFTIIEVVVAMLLASISIAIAYTAYTLIVESYKDFDKKNKKIAEILLLDKMLKQDITSSYSLSRTDSGLLVQSGNTQVEYHFSEHYILRNHQDLRKDTFFVDNSRFTSTFENTESFTGGITDKISFEVNAGNKIIPFIYTKRYSAEELYEGKPGELN